MVSNVKRIRILFTIQTESKLRHPGHKEEEKFKGKQICDDSGLMHVAD